MPIHSRGKRNANQPAGLCLDPPAGPRRVLKKAKRPLRYPVLWWLLVVLVAAALFLAGWIYNTQASSHHPLSVRLPPSVDDANLLPHPQMLGNTNLTDCTLASMGDLAQLWAAMQGRTVAGQVTAQIHAAWETLTTPESQAVGLSFDQGRAWWEEHPLGDIHLSSRAGEILPAQKRGLENAIFELGGVVAGVFMPPNVRRLAPRHPGMTWTVTLSGTPPNSQLGHHMILLAGYSPAGLTAITWGGQFQISWSWWQKFGRVAYAIEPSRFAHHGGPVTTAATIAATVFGSGDESVLPLHSVTTATHSS